MSLNHRIVILADDLTGAADSAVALAGAGGTAEVLLGAGPVPSADAGPGIVSLDLHTRGLAAPDAMRRVAQAGRDAMLSGRRLFKKIDSTLRGHIGAELAALASVVDQDTLFIVAAAHPDLGRTVVNGQLRVHGVAAERSPLRLELEENGFACRHIGGFTETAPAPWQQAWALAAEGNGRRTALICDARTPADLRRVVEASWTLGRHTVWVGSGGLAQAIASVTAPTVDAGSGGAIPDMPAPGRRLFVVGSHAPIARAQVDAMARMGAVAVVDLTLDDLQNASQGDLMHGTAMTRMERARAADQDIVLRPAPDLPVAPSNADGVARGLARWATPMVNGAAALVICGGDTARVLFDRLGVQRLHVRPWTEVGTTLASTTVLPDLPIALKAGAFGDADLLTRLGRKATARSLERD